MSRFVKRVFGKIIIDFFKLIFLVLFLTALVWFIWSVLAQQNFDFGGFYRNLFIVLYGLCVFTEVIAGIIIVMSCQSYAKKFNTSFNEMTEAILDHQFIYKVDKLRLVPNGTELTNADREDGKHTFAEWLQMQRGVRAFADSIAKSLLG